MVKPATTAAKPYFVYIVRCIDNTLYTGIAVDVQARVKEHNSSPSGAKYTRARRPVALVFAKRHGSRSDALKAEYSIKRLSREQKNALISAAHMPSA